MRRGLWLALAAAVVLASSPVFAEEGVLAMNPEDTFATPEQLVRYERLINEFRCVVCQNQSVAESNVDLARDLRRITRDMILEGKTDEEIKAFMTDRYGDFVLYDPPLKPITYLLWGAPVILLLVGAAVMVTVVGRRSHESGEEPDGMGENT
ncbi:cytochrome c-type biogenesis protein [Thioalkalivibrio sp. XN8]|uniref:cytochrome c-type biogenesis protein CcmH n=1 Tax=Thioalkalivibrio sp. XN8 TaxID=2712863 RepID=UPI0013EC2DC2|nr:cytochrome c-type biogenesis protein CcmH [Thioalkalivibrio sp. XN8]